MPSQAKEKPKPGQTADLPGEPWTVADLNKRAAINMVPAQYPVKRWCTSATTMFDKAHAAKLRGDIDDNYILLMKGVSIVVEVIPKHGDFNAKEKDYVDVKKRSLESFNELDSLKKKVNERHAEWVNSLPKTPTPTPTPTPAPQPHSNSILSPSVASITTRMSATSIADTKPTPAPALVPQRAKLPATPSTPTTPPTTDLLAARLKALQPGAAITIPTRQSSFGSQKPAPAIPATASPRHSRTPSDAPLAIPPPLSQSSSNGGSGVGTFATTRTLDDRKMTPDELHSGLVSTNQAGSTMRVLILDVRPMEDYIQGHLRWPDMRADKTAGNESGLVHLEPDWIDDGVDSKYIVDCLRGFTPSSDPRLVMFDKRNGYNLIVCYDAASRSIWDSKPLTNLVSALYLNEQERILGAQPIVLEGGFSGWLEFCKKKSLNVGNWVEIGDGVGGGGIPVGVDGAPPTSSPAIGGRSRQVSGTGVAPSAPSGQGQGQYSPQYQNLPHTNPKVTQYAPPAPQTQNQYNAPLVAHAQHQYGAPPQQQTGQMGSVGMYGYDPSRRGSYLNPTPFDNPFMGFSTGVGGAVGGYAYPTGVAGYPRLSNQGVANGAAGSPLYGRQLSFVGGPTEYPSLAPLTSNAGTGLPLPPAIPQKPTAMQQQQQQPQPQQQQKYAPPQSITQQQQQLQNQHAQAMLQQQQYQQQQYQQYQQQPQYQQQQPQQPLPTAQLQPAAPKPTIHKKPPPVPSKPRLSITSVELTQSSPAYSNPSDFISISTLGTSNGVVGLKNLGNTCFMNSTLQCLSGTAPLARYFNSGNYRKSINRSNPMGTKGVMAEEFSHIIKSMWSGQESIVNPSQFKERVGENAEQFKGTDQHDSQEFLGFLLDAVHEDLNIARTGAKKAKQVDEKAIEDESVPDEIRLQMAWNNYRSQNWSIIVDLFQGQLKNKLECLTCHTTSTTFNPFMYLSLPIPPKNSAGVTNGPVYLDECLDKFVEIEILDGEDAWTCSRCKCKRRTRKTMTIAKLPPILLVHLKRFYFQGPFKSKLETYVDFPLASMDLGKYVPGGAAGSQLYDLYAVSNHTGTLTGGHYTATVHNSSKKQWYNFSDTRVGVCDVNQLK
ncbi:ubiquitin-specific protease doa4, partial [Podochytrium sp. JEL0797]